MVALNWLLARPVLRCREGCMQRSLRRTILLGVLLIVGLAATQEPAREKVDAALAPIVEAARKDLARRLSVEAERIEVVEARSKVWRDGSLGCPEPGMMYTQALQDGALVRLRYGSKVYAYHSGRNREPFLCEPKRKKPAGR